MPYYVDRFHQKDHCGIMRGQKIMIKLYTDKKIHFVVCPSHQVSSCVSVSVLFI